MTESEQDYQIKVAKLAYAVSPKTKLDWALYLARVKAIRSRRPAKVCISNGGILTEYLDVPVTLPCS